MRKPKIGRGCRIGRTLKRAAAATVLLASLLMAPLVTAPAAHANAAYTYVWNDQNSWWPVQARVDYYDGQIAIQPGTWSYWSPVTVPVVNSVYNGYGSCLKFWWLDGSGWHYYGQITNQGAWIWVPHQFERVGVTAIPWNGRAVC
jgi:hypothetical protein